MTHRGGDLGRSSAGGDAKEVGAPAGGVPNGCGDELGARGRRLALTRAAAFTAIGDNKNFRVGHSCR